MRLMSVTPESELVVAPAGIELAGVHALPLAIARVDLGRVGAIRQIQRHQRRKMSHPRAAPPGCVARYAIAAAVVVTGGLRFGITMARAKRAAVNGSTAAMRRAVAQVQVPVVGAADFDFHGGRYE